MIDVRKITNELGKKFPIEYSYCSKCSLWQAGLQAEMDTQEQLDSARNFYGRLWHYTGD